MITNISGKLSNRRIERDGLPSLVLPDLTIWREDIHVRGGEIFVERNEPDMEQFGHKYTYRLDVVYDFEW
jgi:hypothetical protein